MKQEPAIPEKNNSQVDSHPEPRELLDLVRYVVGAAKLCEDAFASTEFKGVRRWEPRTLMHFHILDRLATSRSGCLSQKNLISKPETAKSSAMSSLLDRMEQDGWITRHSPTRPKRQTQPEEEAKRD